MPRVTRVVEAAAAPEPHERVRGVAVRVAPGLEVVAGPDGVEAGALGGDREVEQAARVELLGGRLVAEGQARAWRSGGLHGSDCCISARDARASAGDRERHGPREHEHRPAMRIVTSRRPGRLAQPDDAPQRRQDDRRLAQRGDDRERRPAERREHEGVAPRT